jgi:16S rRNA (cytosine967-C5)-methyltransferase
MSRYHSYINTALQVLPGYKGEQPFPFFIKQYFSAYKKYGSKDRKAIAEICYQWFRAYHIFNGELTIEHLQKAIFLNSSAGNPLLAAVSPELDQLAGNSMEQKMSWLGLPLEKVFPYADELGEAIDGAALCKSYLTQPDLFIRARPGKENAVAAILKEHEISFEQISTDCFALPNGTKLNEILRLNKDVVIQDLNSQKVFDALTEIPGSVAALKIWDTCTASGGKSILIHDKLPYKIKLTVSDIRKNILFNCMERLQQAGIPVQQHFVADLSLASALPVAAEFDIIICDAPCTGSGTWSRNPEQLAYFNPDRIPEFAALQQKIITQVSRYLQPNGLLVYITCSVFKAENEAVLQSLDPALGLDIQSFGYLTGYENRADSMFVSVLKKK